MIKLLSCRLHQCLGLFNMLTVLGYEIHLFFSKCLKLNVDFANSVENWEKIFSLLDNISICWPGFSLLKKKYFSSGVIVLTDGLKIWDIIKKDFFQLKLSQSLEQRWQSYYRADYTSVWDPLTLWLWWSVLKHESLDIYISTYFAAFNFGRT